MLLSTGECELKVCGDMNKNKGKKHAQYSKENKGETYNKRHIHKDGSVQCMNMKS